MKKFIKPPRTLSQYFMSFANKLKRMVSKFWRIKRVRLGIIAGLLVLIVVATTAIIMQMLSMANAYKLGKAEALLPVTSQVMAKKIHFDASQQIFQFNDNTSSSNVDSMGSVNAVTATAHQDASKGVSVSDPVNKIDFNLKPKFNLLPGLQHDDKIVYPMKDAKGWVVYTMQATGVKEDIILSKVQNDSMSFEYTLELGDGMEARLEPDGGVGIYGNTTLTGQVSTATDADALLLQKARQNSAKTTLLFSIPKPVIIEANNQQSKVKAVYSLNGSDLKINVSNLSAGNYPLSIDPSIYVATAQQFMAGNNETNINFNVDNKLIEKSHTTGARFNSWISTKDLNATMWRQGVAAAGGYIYTVGGIHPEGGLVNYTTAGTDTFVVPAGVNSITVKAWGGGGGGGGGGNGTASKGGDGGGGGFAQTTLSVTPGETLNIAVGGGGGFGGGTTRSGEGGGGGGYSRVTRSSTPLIIAAGGAGGGGGGSSSYAGGAGGAGGGTTGVDGTDGSSAPAGLAGTPSSGGAGGNSGRNDGSAGGSLFGGDGADGRSASGADGGTANGGINGGGSGGSRDVNNSYAGGGGGGSGYYGGGGGSSSGTSSRSAGGGGGGSSYTAGAGSVNTAGSGVTPGNSLDPDIGASATGGTGGARRGDGSAGASGRISITYVSDVAPVDTVSWAKFNTSTGAIDDANPGNGTCSGWCTSTAYKLPSPRGNLSLVAYNGFLFAIGGEDPSCTTGNGTGDGGICKTVYVAKIGANGEPRLWHPTDINQNNWVYWYRAGDLTSPRSMTAAVASNNHIYLLGGKTSSGGVVSVTNSVQIADIIPTGELGSWTTSGSNLPFNSYGHGAQIYNQRLYTIGGASSIGGAPSNSVYFTKINNDGSINSWIQTSSFSNGRISNGGNFTSVWGGYIYLSGGCLAVNGSGYCTTVGDDTQMASINADGSLDIWNTNASVSDARMGHSLISWRDRIYEIGGCSSQNSVTGTCTGSLATIKYGVINQDGDASTVDQSVPAGTAPCSGGSAYSCDLPGTSYVGNMLTASFITGGYLYVVGGCTNNSCSNTTGNVSYVAISSTGSMTKPATCPTGTYRGNIWCVDTTNIISGGIAASSPVVFGNVVYLVGGLDGSGNINAINRATINADGSLSAWTSQSMTGLGANSVSYLFAYARANPSAASTAPGNLYIFGGCSSSSSAGCTAYSQNVYKCNILTSGAISACSTSGQQLIGRIPGDGSTGLAIMSGTVYANYIYLIGGVSPNIQDLDGVRYAKFDNNNNVVSADGSGSWVESPNKMEIGRRRAAAFGYNGYIYAMGGYDGTSGSVLADIEFIKVNVSDGSLGSATEGFKVSSVEIHQRWGLSVPISNSFAYIIGGCTVGASPSGCTTRTDTVQTFQIYNNDSGAPAGYTTSANTYTTNPNRIGASSTILNGYIYTAGGCVSTTDCTTAVNNVSYAPIDVNGAIGTWSSTTAPLPAVRAWGRLESSGGSLYYMGGQSSTATDERSEVYYATPSSGNVTTWSTASNGLPSARTKFSSTVWNNRLYAVGGLDSSATATNTVYVSPQLNSGGNITSAWSTSSTPFEVARSGTATVAYANNLYIFGGYTGSAYLSDTQYAQLDKTTGLAGSWTRSTSLPKPIAYADSLAANGYIYLIGGLSSATTCDPSTLVAPVSANTTIVSGNNPTGIGEWYATNQRFSGDRYGASAVYYDGKVYVMGGGCGSGTLTYASPVTQQTTVLSQPQVAQYSIMIDTDSDVFPSNWLLNGVDNSIGAFWQLKTKSMTNTTTVCTSPAMTTWGQETSFNNVTLGLPGIYTPKNGSGVNTNCARFYYFNASVDSSHAFGYPDDVTRGPTITDLTLQFKADPSKRLMHGRTFTGGLQQPVDTPYYTN